MCWTFRPSSNDGDGAAAGADGGEEVPDLVREGVFPADDVALRPPRIQVRVFGFVDQDPAETLFADGHGGIQETEFVQRLEVEQSGCPCRRRFRA
jgi:hypothetical protein